MRGVSILTIACKKPHFGEPPVSLDDDSSAFDVALACAGCTVYTKCSLRLGGVLILHILNSFSNIVSTVVAHWGRNRGRSGSTLVARWCRHGAQGRTVWLVQHRSWRDTAYDFCCMLRERDYLFSRHGR